MEGNPITQLGEYHLIRHLAHGGMSDIYLAYKEGIDQLYAIKLVKQHALSNYQHFRREMAILNTLKNEHILPAFDYYEEEDGIAYYAMPYIEQGSLKERLRNGPLTPEEAATILSQVGDALQFIHERGLVHRDIKPANILLDDTNHVWLVDFGLAKEINASDLTDSNCFLGTPYYVAPELMEGEATSSSDIYALGVVLYEMLTGALPFTGQTPLAICWQHIYALPPLPSALNPCISAAVEQVILQALEKEPRERFSSARAMVEAYQAALLAPTIVIQSKAIVSQVVALRTLEDTIIKAKPRWPRVATLAQQRQRRPLAVAIMMMTLLFAVGIATLAIGFQFQPSTTANVNAQMISLPGHLSTAQPATPSPTATPKPIATQIRNSAGNTTNNPTSDSTDNQGGEPHKHHKQKYHGKGGD